MGAGSSLQCEIQGFSSGPQTWQQAPFLTTSSQKPDALTVILVSLPLNEMMPT